MRCLAFYNYVKTIVVLKEMRYRSFIAILLLYLFLSSYSCLNKEWSDIENGKYSSYLDDECLRMGKLMDEYQKDSCIFVGFITDLHFSSKGSDYKENLLRKGVFNSLHAMSELTEKYNFSLVVMGGDYIQLPQPSSGRQTYQQGVDCVTDVVNFSEKMNAPTFRLRGNHEVTYSGGNEGYGMTSADFFRYSTSKSDAVFQLDGERNWAFYDDEMSKIRYVFLDVVYDKVEKAQLKWLEEKVVATIPDGYSVMVFSHVPLANMGTRTGNNTYKNAITSMEGNGHDVIACVSGHIHSDWHKQEDGILYVTTLQAGFLTSKESEDAVVYEHKRNSREESAFDVIAIDKKRKKIHFVRFGLGKDRDYDY